MGDVKKSRIVYGPVGCGKTRNASAIAKVLGLQTVVDGWSGNESAYQPVGVLYLTNMLPDWAAGSRRTLTFADAMEVVNGRHG